MEHNKIWNAALSARLSKEDGDREESDSISNQRDLIKQFVKSHSDIQIVDEYIDDGYTGVNFDRPDFQRMLRDIKAGKIDCVIVKDLSRFGRNWTEAGKYIDKIFPFMGVRFIAINDNVDTAKERTSSDNLIIPFKNLINETYPRQTSISVRSHLETKRLNGEFIGNFCVFGYKKDNENHNRLIIDEKAAAIVRDIFKWKIQGYSQQAIADKLNDNGVPSPLEYKRQNAENLQTPFQVKRKSDWTAVAVGRILKNEIYTGVLEQGKVTTPNFKVKKRIAKPKSEWVRIDNAHEPIISQIDFKIANGLMQADTRTSPNEKALFLFSGILFCADCKQSMIRKTVPSKGKKYYYYVCSENKNNKTCTSHSIRESKLENAVLLALQHHVRTVLSKERLINLVNEIPYKQAEAQRISKRLSVKRTELESVNNKRFHLYDDYKSGLLTQEEYLIYKKSYDNDFETLTCDIGLLERELNDIVHMQSDKSEWLEEYKSYANLESLTRKTVVTLIERIYVHEKGRIDIQFKYQRLFEMAIQYANEESKGVCVNG